MSVVGLKFWKCQRKRPPLTQNWQNNTCLWQKVERMNLIFFCTLCRIDIEVSSKGKATIDRRASTDKHWDSNRSAAGASSLNFITSGWVMGHVVKHHQSYRSVNCGTKVYPNIYNDLWPVVKHKLKLCAKMSWRLTLSRHTWTTLKRIICTTWWQRMHVSTLKRAYNMRCWIFTVTVMNHWKL